MVHPDDLDAFGLRTRARLLQGVSLLISSLEIVFSLIAAALSGSVALLGFGLQSVVEIGSAFAALWLLKHRPEHDARERAERTTQRIIGSLFLLLAGYVAWDAITSLLRHDHAAPSIIGIAVAIASVTLTPWLVREKRRVARAYGSAALHADASQTVACGVLAGLLLVGVVANALTPWWWVDAVVALIMVPLIAHEGIGALRGTHNHV